MSGEPYRLRTYDGGDHEVELGKITLPESRARPTGPAITLAFYRLKHTRAKPGSPIVFLMGGPGIAASLIAPIPPYWALFDSLRSVADVILLDQRGLGLSSPVLTCPAPSGSVDTNLLSSSARFRAAYRGVVANCAAHFRARGVDPDAYSDQAVADDVDDLRAALGAERVSLLAFSYGTRIAITYARRHPGRLDRILLQGPTDGELMYRSSLWHDSLLARLAILAQADSSVGTFSAHLAGRLGNLLDRADREPFRVRIRSVSGDSLTIPVSRGGLQALVAGRLTDPRIPALVTTLEAGDLAILARWVETLYNDLSTGAGTLMARALPCSAPPSPNRRAAVDSEGHQSLFGPSADNFVLLDPFCSAVRTPAPAPPTSSRSARARITRPALFIAGENDDRTPPSNAESLAAEFDQPVLLIVKNGGHELLPVPAVQAAVVRFFRGEDVGDLDLRVPSPRFLSIAEAKLPPRRPGQ